jgi:hypothetical protein
MSFHGLAQVEVQCIMQMLDRQSLLALARCNSRTLRAADAPFAWKHMPPKLVDDIPIIAYRLGRHIPIRWMKCERCICFVNDTTQLQQRLNQPCNLRGFCIVQSPFVTWVLWSQLVSCVAMQLVRDVCIVSTEVGQDEITALCSLPNLTSIRWCDSPNGYWISHLQSGRLPPNITALQLDRTSFIETKAMFDALLSYVHVKQFAIRLTADSPSNILLTSLANRQAQTLTHLTISGFSYRNPEKPPTLAAAFRGIVSLTLNASLFLFFELDQLSECVDLCDLHLIDEPLDVTFDDILTHTFRLHTSNQAKGKTMRIHLHFSPADFTRVELYELQASTYLTLCCDAHCPTGSRFHSV